MSLRKAIFVARRKSSSLWRNKEREQKMLMAARSRDLQPALLMQMTLQRNDAGQVGQRLLSIDLELDVTHASLANVEQRLHACRRDALLGRRWRQRHFGLHLQLILVLALRLLVTRRLEGLRVFRYIGARRHTRCSLQRLVGGRNEREREI